MAKKKYLITLDPEVHSKLKLYSSEAGVSLGDTINLLTHAAESRTDLARLSGDWAYPEQASSTGPSDTLLRQIELFTLHDAAKVAELEKDKGLSPTPRPLSRGGKSLKDAKKKYE